MTMLLYSLIVMAVCSQGASSKLPDWMVTKITTPTILTKTSTGSLILSNGIISREFATLPDFFTTDYYSHEKQSSLLRAIGPEAQICLDHHTYDVGGIVSDIPRAYLNRTALAQDMKQNTNAFNYVSFKISKPKAPFPYKPQRHAPADITWPPKGLRLDVLFKAPSSAPSVHQDIQVTISYEMYDGIPLLLKWVTAEGQSAASIEVNIAITSVEYLNLNQQWSQQGGYNWLSVETDAPHGTSVAWGTDPTAPSMPGSFQPVVNCTFSNYFTVHGEQFQSFKVHELVIGTADRERAGLAQRRKLRLLAPHTQENPIFFHMTKSDNVSMKTVIDQMVEVGFEMLIYSFGSGFNIESTDEDYIKQVADIVAYANKKGIEVGGYDLIALTRGNSDVNYAALDADLKSIGSSCMAGAWYDYLLDLFTSFMDKTGLSMVETDGPYGGYQCYATNHTHHRGVADSIFWNNVYQARFFTKLRERAVYINQPDNYFYYGGSKTGMGYNENQYSLPRWQDISVSRQGMFDDTYHYIPTVGWMFVPLVQYHGGGEAAMFEPLSQHQVEYEWALAQYLGAGVAACYRGYRLFDSDQTKSLVKKWVDFYKTYRQILISDIIHVKMADMQSIDCYMHVNPYIADKALAMVFNPTHQTLNDTLTLPLYYTGLNATAKVSEQGANPKVYTLDRQYNIDLDVTLPALGITWFVIQ